MLLLLLACAGAVVFFGQVDGGDPDCECTNNGVPHTADGQPTGLFPGDFYDRDLCCQFVDVEPYCYWFGDDECPAKKAKMPDDVRNAKLKSAEKEAQNAFAKMNAYSKT